MSTVTVVGLGGLMRPGSTSLAALRGVLAAVQDAEAATRLFDVRELNLPPYQQDPDVGEPPRVRRSWVQRPESARPIGRLGRMCAHGGG